MESGSALFPDRDLWCWLCSNVSVEETWDLVVIAVGGAALVSGGWQFVSSLLLIIASGVASILALLRGRRPGLMCLPQPTQHLLDLKLRSKPV